MAVVLREEVSLLEVELGEVVVAYVEHLEREGELELEVATEFLVLIAALLELKSRLMLPGPRRSSTTWRPRRRSRSCWRGCSSTGATATLRPSWPSASSPSAATSTARRRCRPSCAGSRSRRRAPSMTPSSSAPPSATC